VVPPASLDEVSAGVEIEVSDRELSVARQLIEMLSGPFDISQYHDDYREAVLAMIERKVAGEQVAVAPAAAPAAPVAPDLMAALQASVEAVGKYNARWDGEEAKPAKRRTRTPAAAAQPRKKTTRQPTKKS
jgi:DNA end-binding protein Ku